MDLRCTKCGRELPSEYWFKVPGICVDCFPKLSPEEVSDLRDRPTAPPKPDLPFPSLSQAFVLFPFLYIAIALATGMLIKGVGASFPEGLRYLLLYLGPWGLLVWFAVGVAASRGQFREPIFSWKWPPTTIFLQIIAIALIIPACAGTLASLLFRPVAGPLFLPTHIDIFIVTRNVLLAPVLEETLFRGIILHSFLKRMTTWKAILASSVLFALFHMPPFRVLVSLPTGLLLGWLYSRYRSIVPTIAVHAVVNAVGVALSLVALGKMGTDGATPTGIQAVAAGLGSVGGLAAVAFWLKHLNKRLSTTITISV
jgi:membrane protease YdiL (CAAX protease family)